MITWIRHHIITRLAATAWWFFMLAFPLWLASGWIRLVREPDILNGSIMLGLTLAIAYPIAREASNARRMGRMVIAGT